MVFFISFHNDLKKLGIFFNESEADWIFLDGHADTEAAHEKKQPSLIHNG